MTLRWWRARRDIPRLVFEAGAATMAQLQGAYACICLVKGVGLLAFRDPFGIRHAPFCMPAASLLLPEGQHAVIRQHAQEAPHAWHIFW